MNSWFLKSIRPEAIDLELCLDSGTSSDLEIKKLNDFEDKLILDYTPVKETPGLKWVQENWNGKMNTYCS